MRRPAAIKLVRLTADTLRVFEALVALKNVTDEVLNGIYLANGSESVDLTHFISKCILRFLKAPTA